MKIRNFTLFDFLYRADLMIYTYKESTQDYWRSHDLQFHRLKTLKGFNANVKNDERGEPHLLPQPNHSNHQSHSSEAQSDVCNSVSSDLTRGDNTANS